ncbi:MAG: sialate O-acetylesterase [Verrucomicrobiota bacterium JB023]|nr:sialate O-acetylesterase [Verrucomicrobiota bacterium JB023]
MMRIRVTLIAILLGSLCAFSQGVLSEPIEIVESEDGALTMDFRGILQISSDLETWEDVDPQPSPGWQLDDSLQDKFFRSKAIPGDGLLQLPPLISDFMVLQREESVPIWGWVAPRVAVEVEFGGTRYEVVTDDQGRWQVDLPAMPITWDPQTLRISTPWEKREFQYITVGDVWLAAGGETVNRPMNEISTPTVQDEVASAFDDMLRVMTVAETKASSPSTVLEGTWSAAYPGATGGLPALPYYAAKQLRAEMGIPVGIIECALDDSAIESFVRSDALAELAEGQALAEANPDAGLAYNGMIAPLAGWPLRGVIWCQDASDATPAKAPIYDKVLEKLITDWRSTWGRDLPFHLIQLPNYNSPSNIDGEGGPWVLMQEEARDVQTRLPGCHLIVANDLGDGSNPLALDYETLGSRLGASLLPADYVSDGDIRSGPLYSHFVSNGAALTIHFDDAEGLSTRNGEEPQGFEIREAQGDWHPASATLAGETVVLSCEELTEPVAARYAWDSNPTDANLINAAGLPASAFATAQTNEMPAYFQDGLVLQREKGADIWGWVRPGSPVTISFADRTWHTSAAPNGRWEITLDNLAASSEGRPLVITDEVGSATLNDVLVGEVWLGGGQSNMDFPLGWLPSPENDHEIATTNDPLLRVFVPVQQARKDPQRFVSGQWLRASSDDIANLPATPYYFAKRLRAELGVPVAVMECAWGGQPIQGFITEEKLLSFPEGVGVLGEKEAAYAAWEEALAQYEEDYAAWEENPKGPEPEYPSGDPQFEANLGGQSFYGLIAPMVGYGCRGIIWYHGEANSFGFSSTDYGELLGALAEDWRARWGETLPFYYMQLPNFDHQGSRPGWVTVQDEQRRALPEIPLSGMAISNDAGDPADIHPAEKSTIGERLARWALGNEYGVTGLSLTGPIYESSLITDQAIEITFTHGSGLTTSDGLPPGSLEIKTSEGTWVPAEGQINGDRLLISAEGVTNPLAARYAWEANPANANLRNADGLPASLFTTDSLQ